MLSVIKGNLGEEKKTLNELIIDFVENSDTFIDINTLSLEKVLSEQNSSQKEELRALMVKKASPLWQYSEAELSDKPEEIFVIGVDNEKLFADGFPLGNKFADPNSISFVNTGKNDRITFIKTSGCIPAFTIKNAKKYKDRYLDKNDKAKRGMPFHIHKDWVESEDLPDLFGISEKENIGLWALAVSDTFGLIYKRGANYYIKSKKIGDGLDDEFKLDSGREKALKSFINNTVLTYEVEKSIDRIIDEKGNKTIIKGLEQDIQNIKSMAKGKKLSEKLEDLYKKEINQIEAFIDELNS